MSEFNADNVTTYKTGDGSDDPDDKMEIAIADDDDKLFEGIDIQIPGLDSIVSAKQEEKKNKMKVDYSLYVKFWSLQDFYRTPQQCYNKIAWKTFTTVCLFCLLVITIFFYYNVANVFNWVFYCYSILRMFLELSSVSNLMIHMLCESIKTLLTT